MPDAPDPDQLRRYVKFAATEAVVNLLFLLPMLLYLFVYDNQLSDSQRDTLLIGTLVVWALISAVLIKTFIWKPAGTKR